MGRIAGTLACLAVVTVVVRAQGPAPLPPHWTGFVDPGSHCLVAVPPDWKIDDGTRATGAEAVSPDRRGIALMTWSPAADFTARIKRLMQPAIIHEDSERRFWSEYGKETAGTHYLAAVPAAGGHCALYVDLSDRAGAVLRATAKEIVDTLGAVR